MPGIEGDDQSRVLILAERSLKNKSPIRRSFFQALRQKQNVMLAVILRDMRTRYFNHGLGFMIVVIWPLAHMFILLTIYRLRGSAPPYGDSLNMFFATGLVPTMSFMYVSRMMMASVINNKPMLHFPEIHISDIIHGRAVLEALGSCLMALFVFLILGFVGDNVVPHDIPNAVSALFATLALAIGVGSVVSLIAVAFPGMVTLYFLVIITVYLLSGTLFVPSSLPQQAIAILSWNPVLQGVEWMRVAYFIGYPDQVLDKGYLIGFAACSFFTGLLLERALRPVFYSK